MKLDTTPNSIRAVVTGAAGVIGRQLTRMLADRGVELLTIDRDPMPTGFEGLSRHVRDDLSTMDMDPVTAFDPHQLFHLAASFERTTESPEYWDIGWRDDVIASHRVVSAATACPSLVVFMFASSYLAYDENQYLHDDPTGTVVPIPETAAIDPRNLCGAGKYYTERELRYTVTVRRPDLRVCSARIYRVYGQGSRDVVSRWVRALLAGEPIQVFNTANVFDYIYASDVSEALARLAASPAASGIVNVGTGRGTCISDVVAALKSAGLDTAGRVNTAADQPPYEASVADVSRLREMLGWSPTTDIETGIRQLVNHERSVRCRS